MSATKKVVERPSPPDGSCHHYVERKKRFCRFPPAKDMKYCAEHSTIYEPELGKKRILCPYNPKHTCYETKLNHHMKKCPSRPREMPPYYSEGINGGDNDGETVPDPKATVLNEPLEVIENIIEKVERLHKEHVSKIEEEILSHPCLNEELRNKDYGTAALRQRKQQASLIGQMDKQGMLKDNTCFLEMGAGKGDMSHWLHGAVTDKKDIGFVLIERSHVRNKRDNLHKEEEAGHVMERVRIDIEHLKLDRIPTIQEHDRKVVAFGKHLCGGATDLALRCVVETLADSHHSNTPHTDNDGSQRKRLKSDIKSLSGVAIALCCHHRCTWTPYVGKSFFKSCGLSAKEFQIISSLSSWATCAWKGWSYQKKCDKKEKEKAIHDGTKENEHLEDVKDVKSTRETDFMTNKIETTNDGIISEDNVKVDLGHPANNTHRLLENTGHNLESFKESDSKIGGPNQSEKTDSECNTINKAVGKRPDITDNNMDMDDLHTPVEDFTNTRIQDKLSQEEREKIGRKCKQLIDYGRVQYLKNHDMSSCLKIYIEEFYTPENVVLLATS